MNDWSITPVVVTRDFGGVASSPIPFIFFFFIFLGQAHACTRLIQEYIYLQYIQVMIIFLRDSHSYTDMFKSTVLSYGSLNTARYLDS